MVNLLRDKGLSAALVCGETPKQDRQELIADFKAGRLRCLVTVLALAIGFDVPDVDCIIWCRPTKSPVLYVQGAGRGMRIANGKTDCLWLDFSDTTERMGPVDTIKGRKKRASSDDDKAAPTKVCPECGERAPISARECPTCGAEFVMDVVQEQRKASNAAIMASQLAAKVTTYDITQVSYAKHKKEGKADSMRVDYYAGLRRVAQEWICFEHGGFAGEKARLWWARRSDIPSPKTNDAIDICNVAKIKEPTQITVDARGEFAQVVSYKWEVPGHA
jgi:DNA repair protein RadD